MIQPAEDRIGTNERYRTTKKESTQLPAANATLRECPTDITVSYPTGHFLLNCHHGASTSLLFNIVFPPVPD